MFRELCKVLVDHVERRLEDRFKNRRDLGSEQILNESESITLDKYKGALTPSRVVIVDITFKTSASRASATLR